MTKTKITLKEVKSAGFKDLNEQWQEMFKIKLAINGEVKILESDLKQGLINEVQKIYNSSVYDYTSFDYYYSREGRAKKIY